MSPPSSHSNCKHDRFYTQPTHYSRQTCYKRPTAEQRAKAATTSISKKNTPPVREDGHLKFPAPLVLPGDDLTLEPESSQSLRSWAREKNRNEVTSDRRTIYVAMPPSVSLEELDVVLQDWTIPNTAENTSGHKTRESSCQRRGRQKQQQQQQVQPVQRPDINAVVEYIAAFYHGLPVQLVPSTFFRFSPWEEDHRIASYIKDLTLTSARKKNLTLGLEVDNGKEEKIGVRIRKPSPDGLFSHQLNLNDLIDGVIEALPDDAYAMIMLTDHDLYEDEEDVFVCGRAYGASRVAVVSTARYNPVLDEHIGLDESHAWPNSHCLQFVEDTVAAAVMATSESDHDDDDGKNPNSNIERQEQQQYVSITNEKSALCAAARAVQQQQQQQQDHQDQQHNKTSQSGSKTTNIDNETAMTALWLGRICRTASHELGHCFAIDHCVYYACCMQGSATLHEDLRQPPYLCPVDLVKVLKATGASAREHYGAMLAFCEKYSGVNMFKAYAAWLRVVISQKEEEEKVVVID